MKRFFLTILVLASFASGQTQLQFGVSSSNGLTVTGLVVTVNPNQIAAGTTAQGNAQALVAGSPNIDITNQGAWTSLCPAVATVNTAGLVTAVSSSATCGVVGQAIIRFASGGLSSTANVQVGLAPLISLASMKAGSCPPTGALCALSPDATNGVGYAFQFAASGGVPYTGGSNGGFPYTWSCTAGCTGQVPTGSGLTLGTSSGQLSGTAGSAGDYNFTVQVTDTQPVSNTLAVTLHIAASSSGPPSYSGSVVSPIIVPEFSNPASPVTPLLSTGCTVNGVTTSCNIVSSSIPTTVTDPSFATWTGQTELSTATRCTDARSAQDNLNHNFAGGVGGSSLFQLCSANSTICGVDAASEYFTLIKKDGSGNNYCAPPTNPYPADHATCTPASNSCSIFITQASDTINPGPTNKTENFGSGDFDLVDPTIWWAFGINTFDSSSALHVNKVTFAGSGTPDGSFSYLNTSGTPKPFVDFQYGLPLGANAPEWQPSTNYAFGQYVQHTLCCYGQLPSRPEYKKWSASTAFATGDIIVPGDLNAAGSPDGQTTNPNKIAYKCSTAGTSGTAGAYAALNFGSKSVGNAHNDVTDGTVKWTGIDSQAVFVMQLTANPGVSGTTSNIYWYANQSPVGGTPLHPDMASTVTDGFSGSVWTNSGPNYIPTSGSAWATTGGVSSDGQKFSTAVSNNSYGPMATGGKITPGYYKGNAIQNTAIFAVEAAYSDPANPGHSGFRLLNTATGIQSNIVCAVFGGHDTSNCPLGTFATWTAQPAAFPAVVNSQPPSVAPYIGPNCNFTIHNAKISTDGLGMFVTLGLLINSPTGSCTSQQNFYEWLPWGTSGAGSWDPYVNLQIYSDGMPHFANGKNNVCASHNGGWGQSSGVMTACHPIQNVSGNTGGLPPGCGQGTPPTYPTQTACVLFSGGTQPFFSYSPYSDSIAGACNNSLTFNSGTGGNNRWDQTGIQQNAYGQFPSTVAGGVGNPSCNVSNVWDWHFDWAYNPSFSDNGTMWGVSNNSNANVPVPIAPWENELTGWPPSPLFTTTPTSPTSAQPKRAFHTFPVGTSNFFSTNVQISSGAIDGTLNLFGSDWNCQFGSTGPQTGSLTGDGKPVNDGSGELGHLPVAYAPYYGQPATAISFCGFPWQANYPYVVGNLIDPTASGATSSGSGGYDVFQAITASGGSNNGGPGATGCTITPCSSTLAQYGTLVTSFKNSNPPTAHASASATDSGSVATYTLTNPGIVALQYVNITGCSIGGYNGASLQVATVSPTQITVNGISGLGSATGCTVYGIGTKVTDNGITWQDVGPQNQRGDVLLVTLR